ncbi:hypothetical protein BVRB_6g143540 [Beta vulgaris subsp. vulgaris]|nr:hypothetical protein BVRB_6g143540 [Beta vulgaris subsp. vulgaris]
MNSNMNSAFRLLPPSLAISIITTVVELSTSPAIRCQIHRKCRRKIVFIAAVAERRLRSKMREKLCLP